MTISSWRDGSWDRCILGPDVLPGVQRVTVDVGRNISEVASPGTAAPKLKDQGGKAGIVKIEVDIWITRTDTSQLDALAAALALINPRRPDGIKTPIPIVHPATALAGIRYVTSPHYSIPPPNGKIGKLTVAIDLIEWFEEEDTTKPASAATTPGPSGGGGTGGTPQTLGDGGPLGDPAVPDPDPANLGADYP